MPKQTKSAAALENLILEGLRAQGVDAQTIEVYRLNEPSIDMTWTIRKLRLNKSSEIHVEGVLKKIVFALEEQYDLAD